ncbi:hypothetical protein BD560DRAFT_295993, partial [Blakeslea trispora]
RRFIETVWDENSDEYKRLTDEGLLMNDGTLLRGYPSLPPDAKIARVKIERLPFMIPRTLRDLMMKRFAHFGTVLDVGLDFDEGTFFDQGYVILDLNCPHPSQPETLRREVDWFADDQRMLRLSWDEMPPYCRYCQKEDHCRAGCPDIRKSKQCYNCNELGHLSKDCPR